MTTYGLTNTRFEIVKELPIKFKPLTKENIKTFNFQDRVICKTLLTESECEILNQYKNKIT